MLKRFEIELGRRGPRDFSGDLERDSRLIAAMLDPAGGLVQRRLLLPGRPQRPAALFYIEYLTETPIINNHILQQLTTFARIGAGAGARAIEQMGISTAEQVHLETGLDQVIDALLEGRAAMLVAGIAGVIVIEVRHYPTRSIEEPINERTVRGPREGFTEVARTNLALVRRRIKDTNLEIRRFTLGDRTRTTVFLCFINGLASPRVVAEVEERLVGIHLDGILSSSAIEESLATERFGIFPLMRATERPDVVAGGLLQGQVAIIIDNEPFALLAPVTINALLQSPEDYYHLWGASTFLRWIRLVGWMTGLLAPALYVALTQVNPTVLPLGMATIIANTREGIPYPPVVEALIMTLAIEMLAEASTRLPAYVGPTATVAGGLIIGTAAAEAKIISNMMIIVVATMGIGTFSIPNYELALAIRAVRYPVMIVAGVLGLFGIVITLLVLTIYVLSLESFGQPYVAPFAPVRAGYTMDSVVYRQPWRVLGRRAKTYTLPQDSHGPDGQHNRA